LVDRERLYAFSGRGRNQQIKLAEHFSITEYPNPAGGCILTDPNLGARIEKFYQDHLQAGASGILANDIRLLLVGRQFRLPGDHWFVLGRNQAENDKILSLAEEGDAVMNMCERPGPTGLLRRAGNIMSTTPAMNETIMQAAGLVVRYGRKIDGQVLPSEVCLELDDEKTTFVADPLTDDQFADWQP
jgi:hypothetical protein